MDQKFLTITISPSHVWIPKSQIETQSLGCFPQIILLRIISETQLKGCNCTQKMATQLHVCLFVDEETIKCRFLMKIYF